MDGGYSALALIGGITLLLLMNALLVMWMGNRPTETDDLATTNSPDAEGDSAA